MSCELHIFLHAAFFDAQANDRAEVVFRHEDVGDDDRLADFGDVVGRRQFAGVVDVDGFPGSGFDFINDRRRGSDEVKVIFAFEAFLHDFHVQHPQETATEAEAECLRSFRFVKERSIVQAQFGQRLAQIFIIVRFDRKETGKNARLHLLETGQAFSGGTGSVGQGIADGRAVDVLDTGDDEADFARTQFAAILRLRGKNAEFGDEMLVAAAHHAHLLPHFQRTVKHAHQRHHADITIEPRIDDERLHRRIGVALRRGDLLDDLFQQFLNAHARFCAHFQRLRRIQADDFFDLFHDAFRLGTGQVNLVKDGQHF